MPAILTDTATTALWHDLLREAEARGRAPLDEELEAYLVFLLMRHLRDGELGGRVLALDLLQGLHAHGSQRGEDLRTVGDRCLLIAGLYPEQAQQRLVSLDYFIGLGAHAYAELAHAARAALGALYARLAGAFARLVRVLVELRRLGGSDPLDAFARHALALADPGAEHGGLLLAPAPARRQ